MPDEQRFSRAVVVVLDSLGIGELPDAAAFGDPGAATLQHIAQAVPGLALPCLEKMGLGRIAPIAGVGAVATPTGFCGRMAELSVGKDTTTGHWELAGLVVREPFSLFPHGFPPEIVDPFVEQTGRGILGNKTASGIQILDELGEEHLRTGQWILYTSADSVFQLAAHEQKISLAELYAACQKARALLDRYRVGRVIARPFVGPPGKFERTYNRHDFSFLPDGPTVLGALVQQGIEVTGVGKISDIFSGQGITRSLPTRGNQDGMAQTEGLIDQGVEGLIFINLVDFDMNFGHRRDPQGYARALEAFDRWLPRLLTRLGPGELLIICADHGCDPTYLAHTDHTREYVPVLMFSPRWTIGGDLGVRQSFADVAATLAEALGAPWAGPGTSLLP